MLAVVALKQPAIECLTLCLSRGINDILLPMAITLKTLRPEESGAMFGRKKLESLDVWASPRVNPIDMLRTPYIWASDGIHSQKSTMPHHPTLMPSSHHSSHQ